MFSRILFKLRISFYCLYIFINKLIRITSNKLSGTLNYIKLLSLKGSNIMKKQINLILTIILLAGCSNPPKESNKLTLGLVQSSVVNGANQTEITKVLGAPNIISKDKQGRETWTYDRISRDSEAKSASFLSLLSPISWFTGVGTASKSSSSTSSKSLTVIITFDDNKSVVDHAYQSLEF